MHNVLAKKLLPLAAITVIVIVNISGCNDSNSDNEVELKSAMDRCADILNTDLSDTSIQMAQFNEATENAPEYCEIIGSINERVSPVDEQNYAIKFHLRLPTTWNGRFYYSGGGGTDGNLGAANIPVIAEGYALVSTDSGHDSATNFTELAGSYQFGFDPQARSDYGYNGPAQVTEKAKSITESFYQNPIDYSYFVGCSEGGREGLMLSQRYPDYFDGIVAGNPGMDLPKAAIAQAWDSQAFAEAARTTTPFGNPDLASAFTESELTIVGNAIIAACDADDGLEDGMLFNPAECEFNPESLGPAGTDELSLQQVNSLQKVFSGAQNSAGDNLYSGWFWDPGIAAGGWRAWKVGPIAPIPGNSGLNVTLGGGALPFIFTTEPNSMTNGTPIAAGTRIVTANPLGQESTVGFGDAFVPWILSFNMDSDAPKIFTTDATYTESAMDFMFSSGTDYTNFKDNGYKLIVYSGQADPVFSSKYHLQWYNELITKNGGLDATRAFARLFLVPGMNHCGGGPSTSSFDALSALKSWVEEDTVPAYIMATAPEDTPWPGRTRPLCAYPEQARYNGSGDIEDHANFSCGLR
ncbi:tannase/feruloyl esterase family alpha/beta hydrolase [Aliiglaciecola sp. LCG003]|uniref:tannase/feruloyl esterase family alpha/beta hydrolase n=1 Tax=Aliiglaciecola sp. LCG003 TaxID=3053655 RepID=UPI00257395CC|nr:tannase/feruloyl esterase family alpha/beta hydrolase [Aliiglaciecola sp. LCG003]WJG09592.1 tannase/feruloyl esterase family alpha/beta hydrolase [Aliiglaciecola sp. LCG003]